MSSPVPRLDSSLLNYSNHGPMKRTELDISLQNSELPVIGKRKVCLLYVLLYHMIVHVGLYQVVCKCVLTYHLFVLFD